jgi:hypothetical protein
MPDVHVLDFSPAIDQNGFRPLLEKLVGGTGVKVAHEQIRKLVNANIMKASRAGRRNSLH